MNINYDLIFNRHKNKPALICGHGPSLDEVKPELQNFKETGGIIFGCNDWNLFYDVVPKYWIFCNSELTMVKMSSEINKWVDRLEVFYADTPDKTNKDWIAQNIKTKVNAYNYCDQNGNSLGEQVQKYTGCSEKYNGGDTVALQMLSFAILMGCNPINIIGVSLDYKWGYANNKTGKKPQNADIQTFKDRSIRNFEILNKSAKCKGIKIFNVSREQKISVFEKGTI